MKVKPTTSNSIQGGYIPPDPGTECCKIMCIVMSGYMSLFMMLLSAVAYVSSVDGITNGVNMHMQKDISQGIFIASILTQGLLTLAFKDEESHVWAMLPSSVGSTATVVMIMLYNIDDCIECRKYLQVVEGDITNKALYDMETYLMYVTFLCSLCIFVIVFTSYIMQNRHDEPICIICKSLLYTIYYMYMGILIMFMLAIACFTESDISTSTGEFNSPNDIERQRYAEML